MRRFLSAFAVMLSVALSLSLSSCLDDDDTEVTYTSDAAITSFSLGTVKRQITVKTSSGKDSTYTTNITATTYKFYIDQINHVIYNPDSLPYGSDPSKVLCNITSKNSSAIVFKQIDSEQLAYFVSTDTMDFSVPRILSAIAPNGNNKIDYTVTVNVHKEKTDTFVWSRQDKETPFAGARALRAFSCGGAMHVFANLNGMRGTYFSCGENEGAEWVENAWTESAALPANICDNVVVMRGDLYLYANGGIYRSQDGNSWVRTANASLQRLVAAGSKMLFALDASGALVSSTDEGISWSREELDSSAELLPTRDINYCLLESAFDDETENVVLLGNREIEGYPADTRAQVWNKMIDLTTRSLNDAWMYVNVNDLNTYGLPRLSPLAALSYDGGILVIGGGGIGECDTPGYQRFYYSTDGGIFWRKKNGMILPEGFEGADAVTMASDTQGRLWLISGSGQVWKGRQSGGTGTVKYVINE